MMRIVFWNVKHNENLQPVNELIDKTKPDIFFLAEFPDRTVVNLNAKYKALQGYINTSPKIHGFKVSETVHCELLQEFKNRLFLWRVEKNDVEILLGVVHLISMNNTNQHVQALEAADYIRQVRFMEELRQNKDTVLIGDFNMNPFDLGMIDAHAFNSVFSEEIANKTDRAFQRTEYDYFYNPSWKNYSGFADEIYGTYFHHSCRSDGFHWNNFDQVLLRPSLVQKYRYRFSVLHNTIPFDLRKKDNGISDHYPILLELMEK